MSTSRPLRIVSTLATLLLTAVSPLRGQPNRLNIEVRQQGDPNGPFLVEVNQIGFVGANSTFIAPNGHAFSRGVRSLQFDQFDELAEAITGEWRIQIVPFGPPGAGESYKFSLRDFTLDDVFNVPPTIVSPTDGQTVPERFLLKWEYPPGTDPPSATTARASQRGSSNATVSFGSFVGQSVEITAELEPRVRQQNVFFTAGTRIPLPGLASPVTPTSANSNRNVTLDFSFADLAPEIMVTVTRFLASDFNEDAVVNTLDYEVWAAGFGDRRAQRADGDSDDDGDVDGKDFLDWQQQFGRSVASAASVPEPTTAATLLLGLLGLLMRRHSR